MSFDYLAPHPFFELELGGGRSLKADSDAIIRGVQQNDFGKLVNVGCCPLPPVGWKDPRSVILVDGKPI
jgi:hypothetical protein